MWVQKCVYKANSWHAVRSVRSGIRSGVHCKSENCGQDRAVLNFSKHTTRHSGVRIRNVDIWIYTHTPGMGRI